MTQEIERTLQYEGGYSFNPDDPGGETNFGIDKASHPDVDIKNLTKDQAIQIYRDYYWDAIYCSSLSNVPIRWKIFDMAVNMGVNHTVKTLQNLVGVTEDGVMGPQTINAVNSSISDDLMNKLVHHCILHYVTIVVKNPKEVIFLMGWATRGLDRGEGL